MVPNLFSKNVGSDRISKMYSSITLFSFAHVILEQPLNVVVALVQPDLEKAGSGGSDACVILSEIMQFLRTFWVKYPILMTEDGGRRVEDGEMRLYQRDLR